MSDNSPGPTSTVQLVPEAKKKNTDLCATCQHKKDTKGYIKITGAPDDRNITIRESELLLKIKYHGKICYARYKRSAERHSQTQSFRKREVNTELPLAGPTSRQKRAKNGANPSLKEKPCITCDQIKCLGDKKELCICEESNSKMLLKATTFNNVSVCTRCILFKGVSDVYAADVSISIHWY